MGPRTSLHRLLDFLGISAGTIGLDAGMRFDVSRYVDPGATDVADDAHLRNVYQRSLFQVDDPVFGSSIDALETISPQARALAGAIVADLGSARSRRTLQSRQGRKLTRRLDAEVDAWLLKTAGGFFDHCHRRAADGHCVGFVLTRTSLKVVHEAAALRRAGWACFLLTLEPPSDAVAGDYEKSFDGILVLPTSSYVLTRAVRLAALSTVHYHASMWDYVVGKHIRQALPATQMVTELDDITSVYAYRSAMRSTFNPELVDLDLLMEGELCRTSDGLLHQFAPAVEPVLRAKHGGLTKVLDLWPMWDWTREVRSSGKVDPFSTVFAGAVLPMGNPRIEPFFPSFGFLGAFRALAEQGIGVRVMLDPGKPHNLDDPSFEPYHALAQRFSHVTFGFGVPPSELLDQLVGYGFGLVLMDYDFAGSQVTPDKLRCALPNKTFCYLAAGIPVIVSAEFEALRALVEENGVGIALSRADIPRAHEIISGVDYGELRRNVEAFKQRSAQTYGTDRLVAFYKSLPERGGSRRAAAPVGDTLVRDPFRTKTP